MPRRAASTSRSSTPKAVPPGVKKSNARKRALDIAAPVMSSSPASGRSVRSTRSKVTPRKSQYFEREGSSSSSDGEDEERSDYEDQASATTAESVDQDEDDYASDSPAPPRKKTKVNTVGKAAPNTNITMTQGNELWRPGVKTGLGPGTQVIIDKPKARPAGKIPYKDDEIHPNTMLFLAELAQNNDREWLKMHDPDYRTSWKDFMTFLEPLQQKIIEIDETIPELPPKDVIFRIYRDIRFSPDPTPYKTHFSAAFSRTGRKGPFAAYYIQIKPKGCFVGGGLWMPEAAPLAKLRRDVDRKPHKIKQMLIDPGIRKEFLGGIGPDEKKAAKAFATQNADNALKTKPKVCPPHKLPMSRC